MRWLIEAAVIVGVTALPYLWVRFFRANLLRRRPTPIGSPSDRLQTWEGRIVASEGELTAPVSQSPCVAWHLDHLFESGEGAAEYHVGSAARPFVLEGFDGRRVVIRFAGQLFWTYGAHEPRPPGKWDTEKFDAAVAAGTMEEHDPWDRVYREVRWRVGDVVCIGGVFRTVPPGTEDPYRVNGQELPVFEVFAAPSMKPWLQRRPSRAAPRFERGSRSDALSLRHRFGDATIVVLGTALIVALSFVLAYEAVIP